MSGLTLPLTDYAVTHTRRQGQVPKGLDALALRVAGMFRRRRIDFAALKAEAALIHENMAALRALAPARLEEKLIAQHRLVRRLAARELSATQRADTLALLAETARRATGLAPYPEQILGALVMERGALAEMATGEGKTLTIGLTAALLAWKGRPCHVISANDYLVERDAAWLKGFYERCGLTVGAVASSLKPPARKEAYAADITYVTSKEVVADFLRDRLTLRHLAHPGRRLIRAFLQPGRDPHANTVMRGLHSAVVDEADHVLIDEAVTPLIISRPIDNLPLETACAQAAALARTLFPGKHYERLPRYRDVELKPAGKKLLEEAAPRLPHIWASPSRCEELLRQALIAKEFFLEGEQYVITGEGKIAIIDESTGRLTPDRTWRQGLHQAIEAKEGIPLTLPSETLSRLSFQRYFRLYSKLCGCTGTAREESGEFWHIYRLPVFRIPTHRPCIRKHLPPALFTNSDAKRAAILEMVVTAHAAGQPVLIGARTVLESETLAARFESRGLSCELLNATRHRQEAAIVAKAGHHGAITIATNMAGRGTDIKLSSGVEALGGLLVIISELHGSARIDRQLEGRSARQGEPGQCRLFVSLEDELAVRYLPAWARAFCRFLILSRIPGARFLALLTFRWAQHRARAQAFRTRKQVPVQDEWLSESLAFAGPDSGD